MLIMNVGMARGVIGVEAYMRSVMVKWSCFGRVIVV